MPGNYRELGRTAQEPPVVLAAAEASAVRGGRPAREGDAAPSAAHLGGSDAAVAALRAVAASAGGRAETAHRARGFAAAVGDAGAGQRAVGARDRFAALPVGCLADGASRSAHPTHVAMQHAAVPRAWRARLRRCVDTDRGYVIERQDLRPRAAPAQPAALFVDAREPSAGVDPGRQRDAARGIVGLPRLPFGDRLDLAHVVVVAAPIRRHAPLGSARGIAVSGRSRSVRLRSLQWGRARRF